VDRKTVVLGVTAAAAVAAAVIVTVANHSSGSPKHKAVAGYITQVDTIEQQLQTGLTQTLRAYHDFVQGDTPTKTLVPRLNAARFTLASLRARLAAVPAPVEARHLRSLLLQLLDTEVGTAREVTQLARFAPAYNGVLKRAKLDGHQLSLALAAVKAPAVHQLRGTRKQVALAESEFTKEADAAAAQQADAIDVYDGKIAGVVQRMRKLAPPAVMKPAYLGQLAALTQSRAAGAALSVELRKTTRTDVAVYGRRFTIAARTAGTLSVQNAQIAAVKAYNRRVNHIGALQSEIQAELRRLQEIAR
jgi:hypothetical protein